MKKLIALLLLFLFSSPFYPQCAMCKAVIEGGNEHMAKGVNNGITYLMIFPYILVGILAFFLIRHRKKNKTQ